jgi:hypothetical protein
MATVVNPSDIGSLGSSVTTVVGGGVVALMCAAGAAGRSPDPLPTFATVVAFCIACAAPVIGLAVLVNRADKPPVRW